MSYQEQQRMMDEFADTTLTAICMRVEASVTALTVELRAMHARHDRLARRVERIEQEREGGP